MTLYLSRGTAAAPRWCVLRTANPGGLITVACADAFDYRPVLIANAIPIDHVCPACRTELAAAEQTAIDEIDAYDQREIEEQITEWENA